MQNICADGTLDGYRSKEQSSIAKSFNNARMKENLQIFDWQLTENELLLIRDQIPQHRGFIGHSFVNPKGLYESLDKLWDGDAWNFPFLLDFVFESVHMSCKLEEYWDGYA